MFERVDVSDFAVSSAPSRLRKSVEFCRRYCLARPTSRFPLAESGRLEFCAAARSVCGGLRAGEPPEAEPVGRRRRCGRLASCSGAARVESEREPAERERERESGAVQRNGGSLVLGAPLLAFGERSEAKWSRNCVKVTAARHTDGQTDGRTGERANGRSLQELARFLCALSLSFYFSIARLRLRLRLRTREPSKLWGPQRAGPSAPARPIVLRRQKAAAPLPPPKQRATATRVFAVNWLSLSLGANQPVRLPASQPDEGSFGVGRAGWACV